jgi:NO-binding membrane sensor protein with MHYT domain
METLHVDFRASWILLAAAISFMGTHTAVSMCEQVRIALCDKEKSPRKWGLLVLVAIALGGVGFFGTFYTGTNALRLRMADNTIVVMQFNPDLVIGSAFLTTVLTFFGLYIASTDECFRRSKSDIMEMFIMRASRTMTIGEIKKMGKFKILFNVCTSSLERIALGGFISGGALALQVYLSLLSLRVKGQVKFQSPWLAPAMIYAFIGVMGGYWVFFRVLSVFNEFDFLRIVCSVNGIFVMIGAHFIALAGTKFEYNPLEPLPDNSAPPNKIVTGVMTTTVLFSFFMLIFVLTDLRICLLKASVQLNMADSALLSLLNRPAHERHQGHRPFSSSAALSSAAGSSSIDGPTDGPLPAIPSADNSQSSSEMQRNNKAIPPEVINYTARYLRRFVELTPVGIDSSNKGTQLKSPPESRNISPRPNCETNSNGHGASEGAVEQDYQQGRGGSAESAGRNSPHSGTSSGSGVILKMIRPGSRIYPSGPSSSTPSPKQPPQQPWRSPHSTNNSSRGASDAAMEPVSVSYRDP